MATCRCSWVVEDNTDCFHLYLVQVVLGTGSAIVPSLVLYRSRNEQSDSCIIVTMELIQSIRLSVSLRTDCLSTLSDPIYSNIAPFTVWSVFELACNFQKFLRPLSCQLSVGIHFLFRSLPGNVNGRGFWYVCVHTQHSEATHSGICATNMWDVNMIYLWQTPELCQSRRFLFLLCVVLWHTHTCWQRSPKYYENAERGDDRNIQTSCHRSRSRPCQRLESNVECFFGCRSSIVAKTCDWGHFWCNSYGNLPCTVPLLLESSLLVC